MYPADVAWPRWQPLPRWECGVWIAVLVIGSVVLVPATWGFWDGSVYLYDDPYYAGPRVTAFTLGIAAAVYIGAMCMFAVLVGAAFVVRYLALRLYRRRRQLLSS